MGPRCHYEERCAGLVRRISLRDHDIRREDLLSVRSARFDDHNGHSRTVIVSCLELAVGRRQFNLDAMLVCRRAVVMVVAGQITLMHMQQRRFGIEAEKRCAQEHCDRPHRPDST